MAAYLGGVLTCDVQSRLQPLALPVISEAPFNSTYPTIDINPARPAQALDGFGFALTGGSAALLAGLDAAARDALLRELFSPAVDEAQPRLHLSALRLTIGASDLSARSFTYCDAPPVSNFDLFAGDAAVVPMLREILAINPALRLIASPWTAPPWMKDNGSFIGGALRPAHFADYAAYFARYVVEMQRQGITVHAVTPQNEPQNDGNEPSMLMTAEAQRHFIAHHLGPALRRAAPETAIYAWDHNCDAPEYPEAILADAEAAAFVEGVAWHLYRGTAETIGAVQARFPAARMYMTEQWVSAAGDPDEDFRWHMRNVIIGALRNSCRLILEWNLASDPACSIHTPCGARRALGGITIGDSIVRNAGYTVMAHSAAFLPPGSVRLESSAPRGLPNVVFDTPDGRRVAIMLNDTGAPATVTIGAEDFFAQVALPPAAAATLHWRRS